MDNLAQQIRNVNLGPDVKLLRTLVQALNDSNSQDDAKQESIDFSNFSKLRKTSIINQWVCLTELRKPRLFFGKWVTGLSMASRYATIHDVKRLVEEFGADVTIRNDVGETALHDACSSKIDVREKITYLILKQPRLSQMPTVYGTLPIHTACRNLETTALETLLSLVDDVALNAATTRGFTALHVSVYFGRYDNVKLLLGRAGIGINAQDANGDTPLHYAAMVRRLDVFVAIATDERCRKNDKNNRKLTAFECMSSALNVLYTIKCLSILSLFVENPEQLRDEHGNNMLHIACSSAVDGDKKVRAIVQKYKYRHLNSQSNKRNELPIHHAAINSDSEVLNVLLNNKYAPCMRVNAPNCDGQTPLHLAVIHNANVNASHLVLHPMIDVNAQDIHRDTPSHIASRVGNSDVIWRLKQHASYKDDVINKAGFTADEEYSVNKLLLEFCESGSAQNVDVMIARGAQPITDKRGNTPLHIAVRSENEPIEKIELLSKLKNSLCDVTNQDGLCPVHVLVQEGKLYTLYSLLRAHPASINLRDSHQQTPLHHAVISNRPDFIKALFMVKNIDLEAKNNDGKTACDLAEESQDTTLRELFEFRLYHMGLNERQPQYKPANNVKRRWLLRKESSINQSAIESVRFINRQFWCFGKSHANRDTILVFNTDLQQLRAIRAEAFRWVYDAIDTNNGDDVLIATDNGLHMHSYEGRSFKVAKGTFTSVVIHHHLLYAAEITKNRVLIFHTDRPWRLRGNINLQLNETFPIVTLSVKDNRLTCRAEGDSVIHELSPSGELSLRSYGSIRNDDAEKLMALRIYDNGDEKNDSVLVTDYQDNTRPHMMTETGEVSVLMLDPPVSQPRGAVLLQNQLYVTSLDKKIIYKYV